MYNNNNVLLLLVLFLLRITAVLHCDCTRRYYTILYYDILYYTILCFQTTLTQTQQKFYEYCSVTAHSMICVCELRTSCLNVYTNNDNNIDNNNNIDNTNSGNNNNYNTNDYIYI